MISWDFIVICHGFYSDLMGYEWDLPSGYVNIAIEDVEAMAIEMT